MNDRSAKKKRKRSVTQGIVSVVFGSGVMVANSYFIPSASISYGAAIIAFHQAARDFVGEAADG